MKKILMLSVVAILAIAGCKKKEDTVSMTVTVSYPIITINGSQYVSIPVGGTFTPPTATAQDTFYKEKNLSVVTNLGTLDNTTPGLYTVVYSAKNTYGFVGTENLYVAVTNVSDTLDLSGWYLRNPPNEVAYVTKLARGLFMTSNVGGDDTISQASSVIPAVFAVTSATTIDFGTQPTSAGTLTANSEVLSLAPADTTLSYAISLPGFGTQVRTFTKQP